MRRIVVQSPMRSLYAKIFVWFLVTIGVTLIVTLAAAALTGTQPFGRRWMTITQDLYAHSAVDFYASGGPPALQRYVDTLAASSGIHGQLLDAHGRDVLGAAAIPEAAAVLAQEEHAGKSCFRLGRIWTAASPVTYLGTRYVFVMEVHPMRGLLDGTFARSVLPRLSLGVLLVALCCLLLARHITLPILVLEDAASQLAAGSLGVRASPQLAGRRDELARVAAAFDHMAERIQHLIATQREMLGHISHELRSPLTRIGVSLELLRRGETESLEQMQLDLDRLNQMIGEILEVTRMDLQQLEADWKNPRTTMTRVRLRLLLEAIAQDAAFEARERGQRIVCETTEDCAVLGDAALLRSCCENVVRNALFYTPNESTIQIRLSCDLLRARAIIEIEDDGSGVVDEALPHLFELFYRAGANSAMHPEGTGFGLAIAQRIVAMHGGEVEARNVTPHGLQVRISLPLAP